MPLAQRAWGEESAVIYDHDAGFAAINHRALPPHALWANGY